MCVRRVILVAALLVMGCAAVIVPAEAQVRRPGGEIIDSKESLYNNIYILKRDGLIIMTFGKNDRYWFESAYDPTDELKLPYVYSHYMGLATAYAKNVRTITEIGFGGGRESWYLHKFMPDVALTSVELDPDVIAMAKKYFGIREDKNFSIVNRDGRLYLKDHPAKYDVLLIDAYRGPFVPFHLMTTEFYKLAKSRLNEGGVLAQNIEPNTMLFDAAIVTLKSVFDNVDLYTANRNIVAIAYDGPQKRKADLKDAAKAMQAKYDFRYDLTDLVKDRRVLKHLPKRKALTDDFAPVEALKAIERHNEKINMYVEEPN